MMKSLSFYEQQHLQRLFQQEGQIKYLFDDFVRRVSPLLAKWSNHGGDQVWVRNTRIENAIDKELSGLHASLLNFITDATIQSWNRGNRKADDLVRSYIEGMSVSEALQNKMFSRNADALNALLKRKDNHGFTVSERVWNVAGSMKNNLEYYLSSGVSVGRPAALISQDVRQLLNEPDRRFRRIRNEEGKLVMSKPMADYHPGQGVYRSAYKNALRLTVTQTNIGYRLADSDRWQKMDFVLGIEIKRSNNNHGPCKICDAMVGKYPKGFVFTGFHPFCICYATPIMMNQEEFADFLLDEQIPEGKIITSLPAGAKKFIWDNEEQLTRTKPYWYKDNFIGSNKPSFLAKVPEKEKRIKTDEEKADIQKRWNERRHNNMPHIMPTKPIKTISDIQRIMDAYMKAYPEEANGKNIQVGKFREKPHRLGFTMMQAYSEKGIIEYNTFKFYKNGTVSPFDRLISALNKIQKKENLLFEEEYSIECFYHEIMHCKAKQYVRLKGHGQGDYKRTAMETINQFVSRHEYRTFIERLGGQAVNQSRILEEGSGYRTWVKNLRDFIKKANIDENKAWIHFKDKLLNGKYDNLDNELVDYIKEHSGTNLSGDDILRLFESRNSTDWQSFLDSLNNNDQ